MKKNKLNKFFSSILAMFMVLSLLTPMSASANTKQLKPFKQNVQTETQLELKAAIAEQMDVLEGGPRLHKNLLGVSGDKEVAVIVHLSEEPVALKQGINELAGKKFTNAQAAKVKADVDAQQSLVKKQMSLKGISVKQGYTFNTVLNGFAATVKANDLKKLLSIPGVTLVEPDVTVYALGDKQATATKSTSNLDKDGKMEAAMNTSLSFLGIKKLWDEGYKGEGIKVAVLDTGIDKHHPEFEGVYKGGKNFIPNSSTYTKTRSADDASETLPSERPAGTPEFNSKGDPFYTSHGTHVAGTIAAAGNNEYGISGIAPDVDLYAYRVLGAYGSGSSSGIIAAIETAVIEKMDIINLSLGGGSNTETDSGSFAINNAMMAGTISVIATGNSGPNRGTMGTPGTARLGIAVGNSTNPETMYNGEVNVKVGNYKFSKQLQLMGTTFGKDLATQLQGELPLVAVPGNGTATDYNGLDVNGKVVLVSRGAIAFVDKIAFAKENGAVGVLIHNFAGGTNAPNESGVFLGDSFGFIPTFDLSQTDGDAIRAALKNGAGTVSFGKYGEAKTLGDDVNDSSSRGPSTPNFDIKPDVTAPGTNIMSSIAMYKEDYPDVSYDQAYDRYTGTSMATPHIAGIVALVKQANPDWNAFDVKVALSNTAKILNTQKYDVFAQGAGRVDAYAAAHPGALAYALDKATLNGSGQIVDNLKGTVTFGPQSLKENLSVTKQIRVKDMAGDGGDYAVSVDVTKSFGDAKLTVDKTAFTLNGEQLLNVTLTASKAEAPKGSELLGYIHIKGGKTEISLPFAADFSGAVASAEIQDMNITETDLSFNGDGVQDAAELTFKLTGAVTTNFIELWDIMNPKGGEFGDGYIGYLHAASSLAAGSYKLPIKGQYKPWGAKPATTIPDGLYTIDFSATAGQEDIGDYVGPIIVKTTKPEIAGSVVRGQATGKVTDKYLDYNEELSLYGLEFDLNDKLSASYVVSKDGVEEHPVPFELEQDGSYAFPVSGFNAVTDSVKVIVEDAAGNVGEKVMISEVDPPDAVITLSVDQSALDMTTGDTATLQVTQTTTPPEGEATEEDVTAQATYTVADENVVTVSEGVVTAVAEGSTTITVSYGGKEVAVAVTVTDEVVVPEPVVSLAPNKAAVELIVDGTEQITISKTVKEEGKADVTTDVTADATYEIENDSIATVEKGLVTAKAAGKTNVTVQFEGHTTTFEVTVTEEVVEPEPVVSLSVNPKSVDLPVSGKKQITVEQVIQEDGKEDIVTNVTADATYAVEKEEIISVNKGEITAKAVGTSKVTITYGGKTTEMTVNVVALPVVSLSTNKNSLNLVVDGKEQLTVLKTVKETGKEDIVKNVTTDASYSVQNLSIVAVEKGLVTAKAAGTTKITVEYEGHSTTVDVIVQNKVIVTPPTPSPITPGEVVVNDSTILNQTSNPQVQEVKVELPALTDAQPQVSAKISYGSINAVAQSSKPLVINSGSTEVNVPNAVVKAIAAGSPDSVTVTVKKSKSDDVEGAVSASYEFTISTVKNGKTTTVSSFSAPVKLTIPTTSTVKDPRKVAAYYMNELKHTLDYSGGTYSEGKFVFKTNHFSKFVVIEHAKTFSDIQKYWAQDEIEVLASRSITSGKTDATFNPEGKITRAEFAVLIARALNLPIDEYQGTFKDVPTSKAWAFAGIEAAYRAGIVNGKTKDSFNPDALITREEIAAIVVRAVKYQDATLLKDVDSSKSFADDKAIGDFAKVSVKQAVGLGIITGRSGNKFDPKANATRAEAGVMLYRALDKMNEF
ncbi:S8 family serine peptidase [Paenisporosarcina sp. FSL H8-0542]|uniref:S8 family serine peptidase n=1 Tax=Paenisporosarcina sp. FSL H8-0542 TaxID=2921401 RepID=UPI003159EDFB